MRRHKNSKEYKKKMEFSFFILFGIIVAIKHAKN